MVYNRIQIRGYNLIILLFTLDNNLYFRLAVNKLYIAEERSDIDQLDLILSEIRPEGFEEPLHDFERNLSRTETRLEDFERLISKRFQVVDVDSGMFVQPQLYYQNPRSLERVVSLLTKFPRREIQYRLDYGLVSVLALRLTPRQG